MKPSSCVACFRAKHGTVFTMAACDSLFSVFHFCMCCELNAFGTVCFIEKINIFYLHKTELQLYCN